MTLPRAMSLTSKDGSVVLSQMPVREIEQLRNESMSWNDITITLTTPFRQQMNSDLLEIEGEIDILSGDAVYIHLQSVGQQSEIIIGYDPAQEWLFTDRSKSGLTDFHPAFASRHGARLAAANGKLKLHIWLDRNAVEVYAANGLVVLTDQIFPDAPIENIQVSTQSGQAVLNSLQIHTLKSIQIPSVSTRQSQGRNDE